MDSELSANVIDLCPVGALTSKPYAFEARPWELKKTESIDVLDAVGSNIRVDTYGWEVKRILPRLNEEINEEWISDKTRYSCDGLLKQRLDVPYIKKNNKLEKSSWDEAFKIISEKLTSYKPNEIAGHLGDMASLETSLAFKLFLNKLGSNNYEVREKKFFINPLEKMNYIFNTSIQKIEDSDIILLIGCNPRHEATMLNARIRKAFVNNKTEIYSVGNPGDLTYNYKIIGNNTKVIKDILEGKHEISLKLKKSKKPIIIIGESALELKSGKYIFEEFKEFLKRNNLINEDWNSLNILPQNASTVGAIDLGILSYNNQNNYTFFEKPKNGDFKFLYLVGSDNLNFNKNNEFIVYQGSHGDRGANIADVVLPSPAYTEQNGLFSNLEGRIQECRKASYPIGSSKEDWLIFNLILKSMGYDESFKSFLALRKQTLNQIKNFSKINQLPVKTKFLETRKEENSFYDEEINIKKIDYYFSNAISRSSKTMSDCRRIRSDEVNKATGT